LRDALDEGQKDVLKYQAWFGEDGLFKMSGDLKSLAG